MVVKPGVDVGDDDDLDGPGEVEHVDNSPGLLSLLGPVSHLPETLSHQLRVWILALQMMMDLLNMDMGIRGISGSNMTSIRIRISLMSI